jgi:hypothetical protein
METLFENSIETKFPSFSKENSGILPTENFEYVSGEFSPEILFALETAKIKFGADAVYFRYFSDERAAIPQLYLFDYTQKRLTKEERKRIHLQMWNGYQVPAYGIIEESSVSIFDARETPKNKKDVYAREIIKLTAQTYNDTIKSFADGLFWEENANHFKFEKSAARDLIQGLKKIYADFQNKSKIDSHVALKLLVQCLLIKYLEERDEKSKSGYFAVTYFKSHFQCKNFCDTIRQGKLLDLLDKLAQDFNGKVFEWSKETEQSARLAIQKAEVRQLADYLDGDNQDNQYVLWRLYSFEHLPVEVISSVYEELLTNSKDIVYTPEMIVGTLVDECMPLSNPQSDFKVIDVSCGSGIFLVKAYKRMIQWWRYEQWQKTGKLEKPSLKELKDILLNSIYGVDIQQDAIRLSVFSLALAILDEVDLNPPTWEQLQFPDLSSNIVTQSFFEYITDKKSEYLTNKSKPVFSLVIGNPPFNLPFDGKGKEPKHEEYFKNLKKEIAYQSEIAIPDENPALHFLVQSMNLLKQDAMLCLIMPAGPLLYQKDLKFKQNLFSQYNLLQVIDFTKLLDKLWGRKKVATAALFLQNSKPDDETVLHLVANRTASNQNRLFLEFDHYDFHWITKEAVLNNPYIWKANLLGGGRIVQLIERLSELPTLGDYLEQKKKDGWKYGEGYTVGNRKHYADYIHNKLSVKPECFEDEGIIRTDIETESHFEAPRKRYREIYLQPHILIKENIGKQSIPVAFLDYDAVFSHEIVGIYAPQKDIVELENLYNILKKSDLFYRFYILATSSRISVGRVTAILKRDIDNLPFTKDTHRLSLADELVIQDTLSCFSKESQGRLSKTTDKHYIDNFSSIFCKTLNSIYQTEERSFQLFKILDAGKYYALHFEYSTENIQETEELVNDLERYIAQTIPDREENQENFHIQRIMKVYGRDCVLLIKPKQLRYWLPSIALRDADEVFAAYIKSRYSHVEK